jgi:hypothetical protein
MRVAHAEFSVGPWATDDPRIRDDFRGRLGVVLSVDREAIERARGQAGSKTGCAFHAIPRNRDEGPLGKLRHMLRIFQRVEALEDRMDGMEQWLEGRK